MKTKIHGRTGQRYTFESWLIETGKPGKVFYSDQPDKNITAIASHYERAVLTKRVIVVEGTRNPIKSKMITKITLL